MAPGMPQAHGKDTIAKVLREMISDHALALKFQASRVEVAKSGDMAYTEGTYTMTMTSPATKKAMADKGSYVTVYKKQADGSWKAVSDIASSETMPTT
jgi:ketosteroid isomerase-like protein